MFHQVDKKSIHLKKKKKMVLRRRFRKMSDCKFKTKYLSGNSAEIRRQSNTFAIIFLKSKI